MGTVSLKIQGLSMADCEDIGGNFFDQRVYRKGRCDVLELVGKHVRPRMDLTRAKLYAFQSTRD